MPFSPERTKEIQSRIDARLQSGQGNDWEESFLTNMAERFQKDGTNTRLSKAQYASLHKVLKLEREPSSRTSAQTNHNAPRPAPKRSTKSYPPRSRPMSVTRAITAPRRAVRRAQRQIMVPLVIAVAFFALIGSFFDSTSSQSTSYGSPTTSAPQTARSAYVYVTGTRVNQRDPGRLRLIGSWAFWLKAPVSNCFLTKDNGRKLGLTGEPAGCPLASCLSIGRPRRNRQHRIVAFVPAMSGSLMVIR